MQSEPIAIRSGFTPMKLRVSLCLGFVALGVELGANYVLRAQACHSQSLFSLHVVTVVCLLLAGIGLALGLSMSGHLPHDKDEEGGKPHDRAHFQALLAVGFNAGFTVAVLAVAIPSWMVNPC